MSQWGKSDNAANSVYWGSQLLNKTANSANRTALYGNTTMGAFVTGQVVGQYGVDVVEAANTAADFKKVAHAGWNLKTQGTGPIANVTITAGGTGYANTDTFRVTATGTGSVNATGTITTNSTGGITALAITNYGAGFTTVAPSVTITTSGGTTATLTARAGGRAGRTSYETLVATGTIS